jgi:hypothetical protein
LFEHSQGSSELPPVEVELEPAQENHRPKLSTSRTNVPDNLAMDSARDTVLQLQVHLGNCVLRENGGVRDITCQPICKQLFHRPDCLKTRSSKHRSTDRTILGYSRSWKRTDSGRLNHIADGEPLDSLVLGRASRAVATADRLDMTAALLVAAAEWKLVNSFIMGHWKYSENSYLFFLFLTIFAVSWSGT